MESAYTRKPAPHEQPAHTEAWLSLCRAPGVGPRQLQSLLHVFGDVVAVCRAPRRELRACGLPEHTVDAIRRPDAEWRRQDRLWLAEPGHHLLHRGSPGYPHLLSMTDDAPLVLFVSGDASLLLRAQVAVVGSRRPSAGGAATARQLAHELAAAGFVVTSGLALGIDAQAHVGALEAAGGTVAVLGCGIDRVYPAQNRVLAQRIQAEGVLVSEFPPGLPPLAGHFPRRNRIISGLSLGVVVVEAARRSGSLITARLAAEQGRDVFAVPGSVRNPMSAGCHALLRDGAALVESAADVLSELQPGLLPAAAAERPPPVALPDSPGERRVLEALGFDSLTLDQLAERTALTTRDLLPILLKFELAGRVSARPGGLFERSVSDCS